MARMPRIKEYRECALHGRQLHAHTLSRRTPAGTAIMVWRCMVCDNERSRAAQRRKAAQRGGLPRPGSRKPMAPVVEGATRPDSMTLED